MLDRVLHETCCCADVAHVLRAAPPIVFALLPEDEASHEDTECILAGDHADMVATWRVWPVVFDLLIEGGHATTTRSRKPHFRRFDV
jgi:hypothetical protein